MFWESISSHSHAYFFLDSMLWGKISRNQVFSLKNCFFQNFDWSNLIFDQSKSCFKNSVSLYLVRLVEPIFRSIEHHGSAFLKRAFDWFKPFFKSSFQTFLLSPTWQGSTTNFLSFSSSIFARFSSLKAGKTIFILLFGFIFMHLKGIFEPL